MVSNFEFRNPLDPNEYIIWEEQGFEEYWVGLFRYLRPRKKAVGFLGKEFVTDNERLGIKIGFDGENFFGTLSCSFQATVA